MQHDGVETVGRDTEGSVGQARPSVVEEARRAAGQDGVGKVR